MQFLRKQINLKHIQFLLLISCILNEQLKGVHGNN